MKREERETIHAELCRLARHKGAYDAEEAYWLREAARAQVHEVLGYATLLEYLERVFGYRPRYARERLRVAEALANLPHIEGALSAGDLSWSAVRELSRVATPEIEERWIDAARGRSIREIEHLVSGKKPGDRPEDLGEPGAQRQTLVLDLSADTFALLREARRHVEEEAGGALDDDAALSMIARYVLVGPKDEGRAPYQVAVTVCSQCDRGFIDGAGEAFEVEPEVIEQARCDAEEIGVIREFDTTHVGQATRASQTIPKRIRRLVRRRDHGRCVVPGCRSARFVEQHHIVPRSEGGTNDPWNLATVCGAHHALVHRGALKIEGRAPDQLRFFAADGTPYGEGASIRDAELRTDAFAALRQLGFKEGEVRRALEKASGDTLEELLRAALARLYPNRASAGASRAGEAVWSWRASATSGAAAGPAGPPPRATWPSRPGLPSARASLSGSSWA